MAELLGIEHIDLTVSDLARSAKFYDAIFGELGFKRIEQDDTQVRWANAHMSFAIRPERIADSAAFDRYRVGLHHLAFKVRSRAAVDELHKFLQRQGMTILDAPAEYPQYGPHYYAVFFADPDGMKLELVHFPWGYWRKVQEQGHDERPRHAVR